MCWPTKAAACLPVWLLEVGRSIPACIYSSCYLPGRGLGESSLVSRKSGPGVVLEEEEGLQARREITPTVALENEEKAHRCG